MRYKPYEMAPVTLVFRITSGSGVAELTRDILEQFAKMYKRSKTFYLGDTVGKVYQDKDNLTLMIEIMGLGRRFIGFLRQKMLAAGFRGMHIHIICIHTHTPTHTYIYIYIYIQHKDK